MSGRAWGISANTKKRGKQTAGRGQEGFVRLPAEIRIKAFGRFAQKRGVKPVSECLLFSTAGSKLIACSEAI